MLFLCIFNIITTKTLTFLSILRKQKSSYFPAKNACGRKNWDKHCDRYSNLTALYITMSADAFLISSDNKISFQSVLCHWNLVHKKVSLRRMWKCPLKEIVNVRHVVKGST